MFLVYHVFFASTVEKKMHSSKTQNQTKKYVAPSIQQVTLFESRFISNVIS